MSVEKSERTMNRVCPTTKFLTRRGGCAVNVVEVFVKRRRDIELEKRENTSTLRNTLFKRNV